MIRNIKALGLAVVAMLAMSALVASAAQAEATTAKFTVGAGVHYPVTLTVTTTAGSEIITTEAGKVECGSIWDGHLNEASQTLTWTITYKECKAFGFLSATVTTDGCDFLHHLVTKLGPDTYEADVDIEGCESGKGLTITASTCKVTIPAQTGIGGGIDLENMTNTPTAVNDITKSFTLNTLTYNVTQDGLGCPFNGTGHRSDGTYTNGSGKTTITAEEKGKTTPVEIHIG